MSRKKVLIGMSGGVDSSVSALILKEMGYDVVGVTMKLRPDEFMNESETGGCCSIDDVDDARRVCYKIGIDHIVMNFTDVFSRDVIEYFVNEYKSGRTPNPCIACNSKIKFDALLKRALTLGFDYIATGHYAKIKYDNNLKRFLLYKSKSSKDQSYVLYNLTQSQMKHTLFPLGDIEKSEIRQIARSNGLIVADKPDSQEICFVPNKDYVSFIENFTGNKSVPGLFVDKDGNVLGTHKGIMHYTIGQRKGLGISFGRPMFVTKINCDNNTVQLGSEVEQYSKFLSVNKLNFIPFDTLENEITVYTKIRSQANPVKAKVVPKNSEILVEFEEAQKSVTPGQSIVFYQDDLVIGGGVIAATDPCVV